MRKKKKKYKKVEDPNIQLFRYISIILSFYSLFSGYTIYAFCFFIISLTCYMFIEYVEEEKK